MWKAPGSWTLAERMAHFEDMVKREGLPAEDRGRAYLVLARAHASLQPDKALQDYAAAIEADPDERLVAELEMGDLLARCGRGRDAEVCHGAIAKGGGSAGAHFNFGVALDESRTD